MSDWLASLLIVFMFILGFGRDCTYTEYEAMKKREAKFIECKHCLRLLK